jgi:hypothetical protein
MTYPTKPDSAHAYTGDVSGGKMTSTASSFLVADFAEHKTSIDEVIDFIQIALRSDGNLHNGIVRPESLSSATRSLFAENTSVGVADDLADMNAMTTTPDVVLLLGYTEAGDGNHGYLRWDSASTATAFGSMVVNPQSRAAGRYIRMYSGRPQFGWGGVLADGAHTYEDPATTGTDQTAAVNAFYAWLEANGGGIPEFAAIGTKAYRIDGNVTRTTSNNGYYAPLGVTLNLGERASGESFEFQGTLGDESTILSATATNHVGGWNANTNTPTLSNGSGSQGDFYLITTSGTTAIDGFAAWTAGSLIVRGASAWAQADNIVLAKGETDIRVPDASLFAVGDYVMPMSATRCMHLEAESSGNRRLGDEGTAYYGDVPIRVSAVDTGTDIVTLSSPLTYNYSVVAPGGILMTRQRSTLRKFNYIEGIRIEGAGHIVGGSVVVNRLYLAREAYVSPDLTCDFGDRFGQQLYTEGCLMGDFSLNCEGLKPDLATPDGHDVANCGKSVGDHLCRWTRVRTKGRSQGFDVTFRTDMWNGVCPTITDYVSKDTQYDGLNFHAGTDGAIVNNITVTRPQRAAIRVRSPGVKINGLEAIGSNATTIGGIESAAWGALDFKMTNFDISGFAYGYHHSALNTDIGPARVNTKLSHGKITGASPTGIFFEGRPAGGETNEVSGIDISHIDFQGVADRGIRIGDYWNAANISYIQCGAMTGSAAFVVYCDNETVRHNISFISGALESTTGLVRTGNTTDTTRFATADYRGNEINIFRGTCRVQGSGFVGTHASGYNPSFAASMTLRLADARHAAVGKMLRYTDAGAATVTVPAYANVKFGRGDQIIILQGIGSGQVTLAGDGFTVNARVGLKTAGEGAVILLTKGEGDDTWYASGDLAA